MKRLRLVILLAVSLLLAASTPAAAQSRSWAAIKGVAAADGAAVVGINVAAIQKTALYKQLLPVLLASEPDAKAHIDQAKKTCGFDPTTVIGDVTVVVSGDEKGVVAVGLRGTTQAKLVACVQKLAAQHGHKGKISAKKGPQGIVEYAMAGEDEKVYAAWLAADVVAVATESEDRALLARLVGGKGVTGDLAGALGKVNSGAAFWVAMAKPTPVPGMGTLKAAYGSVDFKAGSLVVDGHLTMMSAAEARKVVDGVKQELAKNMSQLPPQLASMAKSLSLTAAGDTVNLGLRLTQQELTALLGLLGQMFTGGTGAAPPAP